MKKTLKNVCDFFTGTGFPVIYQGKTDGELPFYKVGDVANNVINGHVYLKLCKNYISRKIAKDIKGIIVPKDTIVFAKIGEALKLNRRSITSTECLIDNNMLGICPKNQIVRTKYFYYFLKQLKMQNLAETTTVPSVKKSTLENVIINIPPLQNQLHIENILNTVSNIISNYQKELTQLDLLTQSLFVEMFGDFVENPKCYKKEPIETHVDLLSGYPFKSSQYVDVGINICGGLIIMPQTIKWEDCLHWESTDGYEEYTLQENDIVMALDRPWISDGFKIAKVDAEHLPALLIQRTARIRAIDINQEYLYYCFIIGGFERHSSITGSLVPHISLKDIRSFQILIPPLKLQEQFADIVGKIDKHKSVIQKSLNETQLLFDSLMQKYFG